MSPSIITEPTISSSSTLTMGNSSSSDQNATLQVPSGPMQSLTFSRIAQDPTNLHIKMSLTGTVATVTDVATNDEIYSFLNKTFSSCSYLKGEQGEILVSIKSGIISNKTHIFPGDQRDKEQFTICDMGSMLNFSMLVVAEFCDIKTGTPCRIVVKGPASQRVVLCYLERGNPTLSQLKNTKDFKTNQGKYQRIGRISMTSKLLARDEYSIEASAGVDLTLLLLLMHVRHVQLEAERTTY